MVIKELYLEERRRRIVDLVEQYGRVTVSDLSRRFGVSEVTIRADLQALADQHYLVRTHGGAVPATASLADLALSMRRQKQVLEKQRIGRRAAEMIADGDAIFLDSSSTSLAIAQHVKDLRHVTAVTNSLAVANELLDASGIQLVLIGGPVQRETTSVIGTQGLQSLQDLNIRRGFFGAHGISVSEGLTDVSSDVAEFKRPLVAICHQVVAVLDATKWGRVGIASFARVDQVDTVVTDAHAPADFVRPVIGKGVEVLLV